MEALPERDSPIFSSLPTNPRITHPPELPLVEHETPSLLQTWQGISSDLAWEQQAQNVPHPPSNLPAVVLGIPQFAQSPMGPTTSLSIPPPSSTSFGITSTYPTLPSSPSMKTHIAGEPRNTLPSYTGTNPYESRHDPLPPQSRTMSLHQSSQYKESQTDLPFQEGEGSPRDLSLRLQRSSPSIPGTEDRQSMSKQRSSGGSMKEPRGEISHRSIVKEKLSTILPQGATPAPRDSPPSMGSSMGEAHRPHQSPPQLPRTLPQLTTPITITRALYLLSTGKLVQVPAVLTRATLGDLFNHLQKELVEDPNWVITLARMDYGHYGMNYILKEEATHFACTAYNMIHRDQQVEVLTRYQWPQIDLPPIVYTPEPMDDEPPVPPPWAAIPNYPRWEPGYAPIQPSYAYPRGYGPPGTQGRSRLFTATITGDEAESSGAPQVPIQPPKPQPPPSGLPLPPSVIPQRWALPRYPSAARATRSPSPMGPRRR